MNVPIFGTIDGRRGGGYHRRKEIAMNALRPLCVILAAALVVAAAGLAGKGEDAEFTASHAMIPMRDGVKLHTVVFAPREAAAPLPFLFRRTPYGTPDSARF